MLLVVEDDEGLQRQLKWAYDGYEVICAGDRAQAIEALRAHEPAVVTLDLGLPPDPDGTDEGFATLAEILRLKPDTKVIVATGHGARESALKAIAMGAYDFYNKPVDIDELGLIVARAFHLHEIEEENRRLEAAPRATVLRLDHHRRAGDAEGRQHHRARRHRPTCRSCCSAQAAPARSCSPARSTKRAAARATSSRSTALRSPKTCSRPSCSATSAAPSPARSSRTSARSSSPQGGTLFLDEVGDIPLPLQVKLLRFLQERVIERIGGRQPIAVDTRIVCATHQDLDAMIADGRFREDLYYRLAEIVVKIPSLAERSGDAVLLARHFVNRFGRELNPARAIAEPRRDRRYRRLRLARQRPRAREPHQARGDHGRRKEHRPPRDLDLQAGVVPSDDVLPINLRAAREVADRKAIRQAMSRTDNNISGAAKLLGDQPTDALRFAEAISPAGLRKVCWQAAASVVSEQSSVS